MTALSIILNIVLILISLALIALVLMQQGQRQGLGAISGGAETFFGKGKAKGMDAKLAKFTKIAATAFIVLAIACTIVVSHIDNGEAADEVVVAAEEIVEASEEAAETEAAEEATEEAAETEAAEEVTEEAAETEAAEEATEEAAEETEAAAAN